MYLMGQQFPNFNVEVMNHVQYVFVEAGEKLRQQPSAQDCATARDGRGCFYTYLKQCWPPEGAESQVYASVGLSKPPKG